MAIALNITTMPYLVYDTRNCNICIMRHLMGTIIFFHINVGVRGGVCTRKVHDS